MLRPCALAGAAMLLLAAHAGAQAPARAGIAVAPPAAVEKDLQERERRIAAEPPLGGLPPRLSYYLRTHSPRLAPIPGFACFGDFDGNGLEDAALLVKDSDSGRLSLVAFHQTTVTVNPGGFTTRDYTAFPVLELPPLADTPGEELALVCNAPGRFESVEGDVALELRHASFSLGFVLHYFVDGKYQSLITGD